jgi:uncharacterized protein involved in exopolysaccharide biosynthesis
MEFNDSGLVTHQAITLGDLWTAISAKKTTVLLLSVFLSIAAFGGSYLIKPTYKADVLLSPTKEEEGLAGPKSGLSSAFGGLASLAGISANSSGATQESIATLNSRVLTDAFIREKSLMPLLFASKWDEKAGRWKATNVKKQPGLWDAERYFAKNIRTTIEDKKTGLVTLTVGWRDPLQAAEWANELVARANTMLRNKAAERSKRNLAYLQQQLEKTTVIDVRQSIDHLIENEIKTLTLAEGAEEYAFKIIDPAVVPRLPSAPDRLLYAIGGLILGFIGGSAYAVLAKQPKVVAPAEQKVV